MANYFSRNFSIQTQVWPLVVLRVGLGFWFLYFGYGKYVAMQGSNKQVSQIASLAKGFPPDWYPWYQSLVTGYIAPNAAFFANLALFGEIAVAIALILGFLTRPALLAGIIMNLNYHFAFGYKSASSGNVLFILAEISLLLTLIGRYFGLDYYLNKRFPRIRFLF